MPTLRVRRSGSWWRPSLSLHGYRICRSRGRYDSRRTLQPLCGRCAAVIGDRFQVPILQSQRIDDRGRAERPPSGCQLRCPDRTSAVLVPTSSSGRILPLFSVRTARHSRGSTTSNSTIVEPSPAKSRHPGADNLRADAVWFRGGGFCDAPSHPGPDPGDIDLRRVTPSGTTGPTDFVVPLARGPVSWLRASRGRLSPQSCTCSRETAGARGLFDTRLGFSATRPRTFSDVCVWGPHNHRLKVHRGEALPGSACSLSKDT